MKVEIEFFSDGVCVIFKNGATIEVYRYKKQEGKYPLDILTTDINAVLKKNIKTEEKF